MDLESDDGVFDESSRTSRSFPFWLVYQKLEESVRQGSQSLLSNSSSSNKNKRLGVFFFAYFYLSIEVAGTDFVSI